jgi:hypothetical protein
MTLCVKLNSRSCHHLDQIITITDYVFRYLCGQLTLQQWVAHQVFLVRTRLLITRKGQIYHLGSFGGPQRRSGYCHLRALSELSNCRVRCIR